MGGKGTFTTHPPGIGTSSVFFFLTLFFANLFLGIRGIFPPPPTSGANAQTVKKDLFRKFTINTKRKYFFVFPP